MRVKQRTHTKRQPVPREIMSATSAAAAGCDQYPRLSSLGTRRARRNIPTVASHRKEVKKRRKKDARGRWARRGGDGEEEESRRILRVCGNRTSPKTLAPSFSASFPPPFFLSWNPCRPRNERPRGESRGRDSDEYRVGGWPEERKREHCARTFTCAFSQRG